MEKNICKKLAEARKIIRESKAKKDGTNEYSKYDYFTPEAVENLVSDACEKVGAICLCSLLADERGFYQYLVFRDLESDSDISFTLRTDAPEIKATNRTQQMGGMDTYSERYIKMKVFCIKDNSMDPDSQDNTENKPKYVEKKTINEGF